MGKIIIDDGYEEYTIENKNGKVLGSVRFNPSDVAMINRFDDVIKHIQEFSQGIDDSQDASVISSSFTEMLSNEINYLFNADVAGAFFSITSPLTPLENGNLYFEVVLNAIGKLIESETGRKVQKMQTKISKYTRKYKG